MNFSHQVDEINSGVNLTERQAYRLMKKISRRRLSPNQIKELLIALNKKGETVEEILGFTRALRRESLKIKTNHNSLVDTCGTGGDGLSTFNISTAAAFIAAGAGVKIAKHGNRSSSSKCGSADVLEALGININLTPKKISACIDEIGIGFIFAKTFHRALEYVAPIRKEIGTKTVFNLLGPLLNPANVMRQVVGVYDRKYVLVIAEVLRRLKMKQAFVVHGEGGLDEFSTLGITEVADLKFKIITHYGIDPDDLGIKRAKLEDLQAYKSKLNSEILRDCLDPRSRSLHTDIALLNAAGAIVVSGLSNNLKEALDIAKYSHASGSASLKLKNLIEFSNR